MAVKATVLFGRPQQAIADLMRAQLSQCQAAWIVTGFATVEGVETLAPALAAQPQKLQAFVLGASTYRGFQSLDRLLAAGVPPDRLHVHLGHTRLTTSGAKYSFYRYHPMMHSKVQLLQMPDGRAVAFIGSHNITGFALLGLNGEAGVMLEGMMTDPEMVEIRSHIDDARNQSTQYTPAMKDAFAWWTEQFIEGLRQQIGADEDDDVENRKTIVVLAARSDQGVPKKGDVIYFEVPEALRLLRGLDAEVHIYLFAARPKSPMEALGSLDQAVQTLWCTTKGVEIEQGGLELKADWYIDDVGGPALVPVKKPFRPRAPAGMQQVRVKVWNNIFDRFEYLFDRKKIAWVPELDEEDQVRVDPKDGEMLRHLELVPPQDREWFLVRSLRPAEDDGAPAGKYEMALRQTAPDSGNFVLLSHRRRKLPRRENHEQQ